MDPQYYQPLSHALHPPRSSSQPQFYKTMSIEQQKLAESDDDDEGMVEEELSRTSAPSSPKPTPAARDNQPPSTQEHEPRRRGRPRGSKNRRNRVSNTQTPVKSSPPSHQPLNLPGQGTAPPQLPVTAQNQQYYEFQWRVLNLCAEFYGAAEELVKATPALVIAQCYQMGPGSKVDPLNMLNEAKQKCDALLANPSRLITSPPPPMYPVVPSFYTAPPPAPAPSVPVPASGVPVSTSPPTVISQPQSFVVSMSNSAYPVYSQYPTTSYYQYPYGHPGAYYAPVPPPPTNTAAPQSQAPVTPAPTSSSSALTISGAWSDDETERLKKLADEKRNSAGEIDWDDVVNLWGNGRSRHQILIKATQLGLKESSSIRGVKRRREGDSNDPAASTSAAPTPTPAAVAPNSSSTPSSTPMASPSLQNQKQPQSSAPKASSAVPPPPTTQPWPMPVVAVNTSSPVIGASPSVTSYYRPRPPSASSPKPTTGLPPVHRYMYQPNGHQSDSTK
ncbi:hypothetical protein GYMLUDRAFT_58205 [Collybiopsis luxurians FD-317 M1]|uniref:Uncharacterized protein n=1 Tax=Collybiopsis luxurians FD-317 M1 TaxID=944289 RepID=A0A0D0CID7_9AGAR|nr:hypothetical protein GYMLUDRAFT_58205 [Collybiopsis luxurians FD-317 M1]